MVVVEVVDRWEQVPATNSPAFIGWLILRLADDVHEIAKVAPVVATALVGIESALTSIAQSLGDDLEGRVGEISIEIAKRGQQIEEALDTIPIIGRIRRSRHSQAA